MRVVVTGGSGQLGSRVLRRLAEEPAIESITSIDLRPPMVASPKILAVPGDVRDPDLGRRLTAHDALVHLAFVVAKACPRPEMDDINVSGSANVFAAAARAGIRRIVYSSSIAAYGVVPGHPEPITEDTTRVFQPDFAYAANKFQVEALLDEFDRAHPDIAVARLRPAILVGHDMDHFLGDGLRRRRLFDTNGAPLPIVWDEDVADAVALCLLGSARGAFNVTADDFLPVRELARRAGLRAVWVPRWLVPRAATILPRLARLGVGRAMDPGWLSAAAVRMIVSSERAKRELGWKPRCPTAADVIARYCDEVPRRLDRRLAIFFRAIERIGPPATNAAGIPIHLRLTGPDGGDFTIASEHGRLAIRPGVPRPPGAALALGTNALRQLISGAIDVTTAEKAGQLRVDGEPTAALVLADIVAGFRAARSLPGLRGALARRAGSLFADLPRRPTPEARPSP